MFLWAPFGDWAGDAENDNLLASGARSGQADPDKRSRGARWENALMLRFILKIWG